MIDTRPYAEAQRAIEWHCPHRDAGYCARPTCRLPLHVWAADGIAWQFPSAGALVAFVRTMGAAAAAATRAAWLADAR